MKFVISIGVLISVVGCSNLPERSRAQIAGTPFDNGGLSTRTQQLQREARRKGLDASSAEAVRVSQAQDLTAVIKECKQRLERVSMLRKQSNDISLGIALAGLVAGAIIGPTLVATSASKGAIAFFSSIGGAANTAQSQFSDRGYSAEAYAQRLGDTYAAIGRHFEEFSKAADDASREKAILGLTADCLVQD